MSLQSRSVVFAALGDDTRLRLVERLASEGEVSISRLAFGEPISRQAITKHLEVLAGAGLVASARRGRERVWRLEPVRIDEARAFLTQVAGAWDQALGRLKALVEADAGG